MILIYGIVLLGDILLTWATLQQPYKSKTLLAPPPQNKNDWVHSVIFEPQPRMLLTHSTYKITSFFRFSTIPPRFSNSRCIHQKSYDRYCKSCIF